MSVLDVLTELNVFDLSVKGDEVWGLCPRHLERAGKIDRTASWSINTESLLHHCFSCGYSGSLVGLAVDVLEVSEIHAARWVRSKGLHVTAKDLDREKYEIPQMEEALLAPFTDPPEDVCDARGFMPHVAQQVGVLWNRRRSSWVCPIRDPWTGKLWGWQEKFTDVKAFKNYPQGIKKSLTLFGIDTFPVGEKAVIVESPLDVARLRQVGIYALACWGGSISEAQLRVLLAVTQNVILFFDDDDAGRKFTQESVDLLKRRAVSYNFADYQYAPGCKDPGDMTNDQAYDCVKYAYRRIRTIKTDLL